MGSTKRLIGEQVLYRLYGGTNNSTNPVHLEDVYKALEQKLNAKFKVHQFDTNIAGGEIIPNGICLATYESVTVTSDGDKSKATLPIVPIAIPRNMGIFSVYTNEIEFIPLQAGQERLLRTDELLNDLMAQIGYTPKGKTIYFTKDLTLLGITSVSMDLTVFDMSQYSVTDVLPMPADMEEEIVNELVLQFSPVQPEVGLNSTFAEPQRQGK
jgi:hypothetical protein